jgi:arsenate reductase
MTVARQVKIDVLVFEGCPHAEAALTLSQTVAKRFGPRIVVERIEVSTPEMAAQVGFIGSPSIRVNGEDLEGRNTTHGVLCCRTYEDGAGVPPEWLVETAVLRALQPRGVLFLCVANSARSQMAEGIARALLPAEVKVWSAGSYPTKVRPEAIEVLREIGIDISTNYSKNVAEVPVDEIEVVVTLCAEEECPLFLGKATRLHWGLPDPAGTQGSADERLASFRKVRDELRRRIQIFGETQEKKGDLK